MKTQNVQNVDFNFFLQLDITKVLKSIIMIIIIIIIYVKKILI